MIRQTDLAGTFLLPGTSMTVNRVGYGTMQLAGPEVWGPPRDVDTAIAVLREAVDSGVNHIDYQRLLRSSHHQSANQAGASSVWQGSCNRHQGRRSPR